MTDQTAWPVLGPEPTTAVTRSFRHLDTTKWLAVVALTQAMQATLLHPFNVVVARMRTTTEKVSFLHAFDEGVKALRMPIGNHTSTYRRMRMTIRHVFRDSTLFRGYGVLLAGTVTSECVYAFSVERFKHELGLRDGSSGPSGVVLSHLGRDFIAGAAATMAALMFFPCSVISTRQMTAGYGLQLGMPYEDAFGTLRRAAKQEQSKTTMLGCCRGLYAGFGAALIYVPVGGVWWLVYGVAKRSLYGLASVTAGPTPNNTSLILSRTDNPAINGAAGVIASGIVALVLNPITVIKTRMQVHATADGSNKSSLRATYRSVCYDLFRQNGYRGFWKGASLTVGIAAFEGMFFGVAFEAAKFVGDVSVP